MDKQKEEARRLMQAKLAEAERLIGECVALADEHGICFRQPNDGGYGTYTPVGHGDNEWDVHLSSPGEYEGWTSSNICFRY